MVLLLRKLSVLASEETIREDDESVDDDESVRLWMMTHVVFEGQLLGRQTPKGLQLMRRPGAEGHPLGRQDPKGLQQ